MYASIYLLEIFRLGAMRGCAIRIYISSSSRTLIILSPMTSMRTLRSCAGSQVREHVPRQLFFISPWRGSKDNSRGGVVWLLEGNQGMEGVRVALHDVMRALSLSKDYLQYVMQNTTHC